MRPIDLEFLRREFERRLDAEIRFETSGRDGSLLWEVRVGRWHAWGDVDSRVFRIVDRSKALDLLFRTLLDGLRDALFDERIWKRRCLEFVS